MTGRAGTGSTSGPGRAGCWRCCCSPMSARTTRRPGWCAGRICMSRSSWRRTVRRAPALMRSSGGRRFVQAGRARDRAGRGRVLVPSVRGAHRDLAAPGHRAADDRPARRARPRWVRAGRVGSLAGGPGHRGGTGEGGAKLTAHVRWHSQQGPDDRANARALCVLHHALFGGRAAGTLAGCQSRTFPRKRFVKTFTSRFRGYARRRLGTSRGPDHRQAHPAPVPRRIRRDRPARAVPRLSGAPT